MSRLLKVLYVEDSAIQQRLMAHALRGVKEFTFEVVSASSEEGGVEAFQQHSFDLVMVDYHLEHGNGLNLVRRLREIDQIVPIIAVSGVAPEAIAADLVISGADDYLDKTNLDMRSLGRSIRISLLRADGIRQRLPGHGKARSVSHEINDLSHWLANGGIPGLLAIIDRCEASAKDSGVTPLKLVELFREAAREMAATGIDPSAATHALRPFFHELSTRLFKTATVTP